MRLGKLVRGHPAIFVLFERFEAHGAEDLLRRAEASQQPLEIVCPFNATADLICQHRFGGARRADDEDVMRCQESREGSVDQVAPLKKTLLQLLADLLKLFLFRHNGGKG